MTRRTGAKKGIPKSVLTPNVIKNLLITQLEEKYIAVLLAKILFGNNAFVIGRKHFLRKAIMLKVEPILKVNQNGHQQQQCERKKKVNSNEFKEILDNAMKRR